MNFICKFNTDVPVISNMNHHQLLSIFKFNTLPLEFRFLIKNKHLRYSSLDNNKLVIDEVDCKVENTLS